MRLEQLTVATGKFDGSVSTIRARSRDVRDILNSIEDAFRRVEGLWQSPAEASFEPLAAELRTHSLELTDLLDEMVRRLGITLSNYEETEKRARENLTPHGIG